MVTETYGEFTAPTDWPDEVLGPLSTTIDTEFCTVGATTGGVVGVVLPLEPPPPPQATNNRLLSRQTRYVKGRMVISGQRMSLGVTPCGNKAGT